MYCVFFILLLIDKHLDLFCVLAVFNNVAINMGAHRYRFTVLTENPLDVYPVVRQLDCTVVLFFTFLRKLLFPRNGCTVYSYQQCVRVLFSHVITNTYNIFYF